MVGKPGMLRKLLFVLLLVPRMGWAQPTTIMTWNLLNFNVSSTERVPHYRMVIDSMKPEILAVQELQGQAAATYFKQQVIQGQLAMAPFISGPDSDNALFYDSLLFSVVQMQAIPTTLRDISWFTLRHTATSDTLHVFVAHLKASSGAANEAQRLAEVNLLRTVTDALPDDSYFIVCGDFNFYGSNEPAYQRLLEQDGSHGFFVDPLGYEGTWNTPNYAIHHTQSPRVRNFGGGASGGLDDRFDLILFSFSFGPNGAIQYMYNTSWAVGNSGELYNDSINSPSNTSVSHAMANALHDASDHLPVVTSFRFMNTSMEEVSPKHGYTVYPNPSSDVFTVAWSSFQRTYGCKVYDAAGKEVLVGTGNGSVPLQLDLHRQPAGIYLLQLTTEETQEQVRLVKEW